MNDQDLGQGGATQSTQTSTPPKDAASVDLLGDATAAAIQSANAIHDAFLMGWSLQELKSRVLLRTFGLHPSAPTKDSTPETELASAGSVSGVESLVDTLLKAVLPPASPVTTQRQGMPSNLNKSIARTSEWRAIFIRIASVHDQCFPASTIKGTPYDPSPTSSPESRFPYLYPSTSPNYALIGISGSGSVGVGDLDERLGKFELYDVTRRTLNCLTLLYTRPEESLLPDIIRTCQTQIVQSILNQAPAPGTVTPAPQDGLDQESAAQEGLNQKVTEVLQAYLNDASAGPSQDALNTAIKVLSFLTVRFLDSWDGYLRENFYVGGRLKNNELELLAYEAGRSLSSLSWGISLMTVPLENDLEQNPDSAQLLTQLSATWTNVFKSASINAVQRQVSALGPALDDAYYVLKKVQRPTAGERPSPDLPSRAIHALTYSLVYWQRAIEWICRRSPSGTAVSTTTTAAAIETTTTSASLSPPPVNTAVSTTTTAVAIETTTTSASPSDGMAKPLALSPALLRQLRQALVNQAGIWQSLMLGEQTLQSFTTESVTKRILRDIMVELESTVSKITADSSKDALERFRTPMIVGGVLLLLILGGGLWLLVLTGQLQGLAAIVALLTGSAVAFFSTALSRVGSIFSPVADGQSSSTKAAANTTGLGQGLSSLFGLADEAIVTAFQNAYKQILLKFDDLNHYVAISYPLIDLFIMNSPQIDEEIKDSYIFLTKIVWTGAEQKEEIERVARAAFGPLGALIGPPLDVLVSRNSVASASTASVVAKISSDGKSRAGLAAKR